MRLLSQLQMPAGKLAKQESLAGKELESKTHFFADILWSGQMWRELVTPAAAANCRLSVCRLSVAIGGNWWQLVKGPSQSSSAQRLAVEDLFVRHLGH